MQEGTVKFFNESKGFGFISNANGGEDVFVHVSGLIDKVNENDQVTFDIEKGKKGLMAVNVNIVQKKESLYKDSFF
ncbi:cold shock domain-containing protein [Empedobacter sp.]|uniref:cold-shock protein n=1 Tax=Empedobacter sp. TaxID=1927715 RepID=UPI0028A0BBC9|nr:cold shock domain-containing protein [Empedobacter sp.]